MKYAIALTDGCAAWGPFDDKDQATAWATARMPNASWRLIELRDPWWL